MRLEVVQSRQLVLDRNRLRRGEDDVPRRAHEVLEPPVVLQGELVRRHYDHGVHPVRHRVPLDLVRHGEHHPERLAGPCLRVGDHVLAAEDVRDQRRLQLGQLLDVQSPQLAAQRRAQARLARGALHKNEGARFVGLVEVLHRLGDHLGAADARRGVEAVLELLHGALLDGPLAGAHQVSVQHLPKRRRDGVLPHRGNPREEP
mmetsp:Transcript_45132/g.139231  ORF Transcript_45132/g.139231 Transcript_45132/m.139231 type:complete len:203 (-) Transcript_45132:70-678(-)